MSLLYPAPRKLTRQWSCDCWGHGVGNMRRQNVLQLYDVNKEFIQRRLISTNVIREHKALLDTISIRKITLY
jgi:hypothetical protein